MFAPREPRIASLSMLADDMARIEIAESEGKERTFYNIYRDGRLAASSLTSTVWTDRNGGLGSCYSVEAQFARSGNRSHHSAPACTAAPIEVTAPARQWGKPGDTYSLDAIKVAQAGRYQVQLRYHNSANQINLGISGGVKWLSLKDADGRTVAQGVVQLPHTRLEQGKPLVAYSTPLEAQLVAGTYRLHLGDFYNMSYLQANSSFSAAGGSDGPANSVDLYGVRLQRTDTP